jgi:hypothetical protein
MPVFVYLRSSNLTGKDGPYEFLRLALKVVLQNERLCGCNPAVIKCMSDKMRSSGLIQLSEQRCIARVT